MRVEGFQRKGAETRRRKGVLDSKRGLRTYGSCVLKSGAERPHSRTWRIFERSPWSRKRPGVRLLCAAFRSVDYALIGQVIERFCYTYGKRGATRPTLQRLGSSSEADETFDFRFCGGGL
jgi:hypothetical protein